MLFRFNHPEFLWLLLVIPFLLFWKGRRGKPAAVLYSSIALLRQAAKTTHNRPGRFRFLIRLLSLTLLMLALAQPQTGSDTTEIEASGVDIVLAVDISPSMLALDFSTRSEELTRLDAVKKVVASFIDQRPNDRIGIVAFARNPYLVSPITLNHDWLDQNLERLEVGLIEPGTNVGGALGSSINRLRHSKAKSRIIILLTDGQDDPPPTIHPTVFAEAASRLGIKIYTVAAGSGGDVPTYMLDRNGSIATDRFGRKVIRQAHFPVDEKVLQDIARLANGRSYRADNQETLRKIYAEIDQLEKTDVQMKYKSIYTDRFIWLIAVAMGLLAIEFIITHLILRRLP
jgi:Ca-activated chloride channel family protein